MEFSYETREADVLDGVEISDRKNRVDAHRNFQLLGVFVVIWMFWGDLFKNNGTQTLVSWVMVIAALALLFLILKFPANNNRKYAARLKEHSPRFELAATRDGIDVREGGGKYYIAFSGSCSVYDYKGVYAICYDKNKVVAVPKNQLDEATAERFCGVLRQGSATGSRRWPRTRGGPSSERGNEFPAEIQAARIGDDTDEEGNP